jgi:uncharacterized protein
MKIKRDIEKNLKEWKEDNSRKPLLIRGARQVGKSHTIMEFGKYEFETLITINFEQYPEYKACFKTLVPQDIINSIAMLAKRDVVPGKTLLFLDEIQECPQAITALRYFYEQMPLLHVIGAGSLMEFTLRKEGLKMPVGRIQNLFMKPLSFYEFLDAMGEEKIREYMETYTWSETVNEAIHNRLMELVKKYSIVGGMPSVVVEYVTEGSLIRCDQVQSSIIQTYREDFGKYAGKAKHKYLDRVFYAVPKMVGKKFKYSQVDDAMQSRDLKEALESLEKAGVVRRIKSTGGSGLPLEAESKEKHFKTVFMDIGLMQNICGLSSETAMTDDFISVNAGALAEQFVAQELIAYQENYKEPSLYYWAREAKSSNAEVDYLIPCFSSVVPVEVKAGKTGRLRSMHLFLEKYPAKLGVRISQQEYNNTLPIITLPFYGIKGISRLTKPYL